MAPKISDLRWRVTLLNRKDFESTVSAGIDEVFTNARQVWADIRPIGTQLWIGSMQTEFEVTHRIIMRWLPPSVTDSFAYAFRTTFAPDRTLITERYRLLRRSDFEGRKQWLVFDAIEERLG